MLRPVSACLARCLSAVVLGSPCVPQRWVACSASRETLAKCRLWAQTRYPAASRKLALRFLAASEGTLAIYGCEIVLKTPAVFRQISALSISCTCVSTVQAVLNPTPHLAAQPDSQQKNLFDLHLQFFSASGLGRRSDVAAGLPKSFQTEGVNIC